MAGIELEDWITSSNECFEINLTRPSEEGTDAHLVFPESFSPTFTYPIFGEKELLVGYKDPSIDLTFRANDLLPKLKVQFEQKVDLSTILQGEDEQIDLEHVWENYLPAPAETPDSTTENDPTSKSWKPPGKLLHNFTLQGRQYEIWSSNMTDPAARRIWENMKILTLLFIEGASYPDLDEEWSNERWTLYLLYEVTPVEEDTCPYTLAGFSTSYRYWIFPTAEVLRAIGSLPSPTPSANGDATTYTKPRILQDSSETLFAEKTNPLEEPSRERISQFLILPPYQGQSLGATLYDTIFADLVKKPFIYEVPVEDPSEDFDAMRDYSDIVYLRNIPEFASLTLPSSLPPALIHKSAPIPRDQILGNGIPSLDDLRHKSKIVPRQFNRMLELHLLSTIPPLNRNKARITRKDKSSSENDRRYYFWRLALKDRIYKQNADVLEQVDAAERVEKLEMAVDNQQAEYEEREEGIERRKKWEKGEASKKGKGKRKRTVVDEDEDDEWEDEEGEASRSAKKPKS